MGTLHIPLTQGRTALIDEADLPLIEGLKFSALRSATKNRDVYYARAWSLGAVVSLHRVIMGASPGQMVDHINGDGLDCRRSNLRFATKAQNAANTPLPVGKCGYRGVRTRVKNGRTGYRTTLCANGKRFDKGPYSDPAQAARAYDALAIKHHGEFAVLNFPVGA